MDFTGVNHLDYPNADLTNKFFGYLVASQMNTVESISRIETDMTISKDKNSQLERAVEKLANKCEILEGTINSLRNLFIAGNNSRKASLYDLNFSEFSSQTYKFKNSVCESNSECNVPIETPGKRPQIEQSFSPLASLIEVCSDLYKQEASSDPESSDLKRSAKLETDPQVPNNLSSFETPVKQTSICCQNCSSKHSVLRRTLGLESPGKEKVDLKEDEKKEIQRLFNKRVKYEVNRKFGRFYLIKHQVRELDVKEMHRIKKKVLRIFAPFPLPIKAAWSNAMNSLRQDRHQLKKKRFLNRK